MGVSGVRNVRFSENLACLVCLKHPLWDSLFCLITDELSELEESDFEENTDITTEVIPRIREVEEQIVEDETEEEKAVINNE